MTQDRLNPMPDELDARLAKYLDWQSGQLRGVPGSEEIATRIAGGVVRRRALGRGMLAWAAIAVALLMVVAVAIFIGGSPNPLVVVATSSPTTQPSPSTSRRPADPTSAPSHGPGPCGSGRVEIGAANGAPVPTEAAAIQVPIGGLIAMALEETPDRGSIVIAGPGQSLRMVAIFSGEELRSPATVQVVSWSPTGDALLVWAGHESTSLQGNCGNLYLVRADGAGAERITDHGTGEWADLAAFSPSGTRIAYTQGDALHIVSRTAGAETKTFDIRPCSNGPNGIRWAPDETRILLTCDAALVVVDVEGVVPRHFLLPGSGLDARWSSTGESIVATVANDSQASLAETVLVLDIDPLDGTMDTRLESDQSSVWVLGAPLLSPDGRWLLVWGNGDVLPDPFYPTWLVDTTTNDTIKLAWPVLTDLTGLGGDYDRLPGAVWLDGNRVLSEDAGTLYEYDLSGLTRTAVGAVPAQDFAWFAIPR